MRETSPSPPSWMSEGRSPLTTVIPRCWSSGAKTATRSWTRTGAVLVTRCSVPTAAPTGWKSVTNTCDPWQA